MSRNASLLEANKVLSEKYTKVKGLLEEILVADISQVVHDKITALGFSSHDTQPREIVYKSPCINPPTPVSRRTSTELEHHVASVYGYSLSSPHVTSPTGPFPSERTRTVCHPILESREDRRLPAYMTSCQSSDDRRSDCENSGRNMTASTAPHELFL